MTLDKLLKRLSNGEEEAFEEIYTQTRKTVYYIALSIVKERSLAEDVMQNVYLSVLKNASQYRHGTNAAAWIARITRNEALKLMKSRGRVYYMDERANEKIFGTGRPDDYGLLIDLARRILPEDEFVILMLVAAVGYKRREIAEMLDMPLNTVTWKFNKATEKMRKSLKEN